MKNPTSVSHEDALEILFSNRNRAYGAYQLRRQYTSALARALGFGLLLIALLMGLPQILKAFSSLMPTTVPNDREYKITEIYIPPPPPKPPVTSTPPPPARSTQRFVPPVVEDDNKVIEEPPKLTNDDLLKNPSDVGKVTVDVLIQGNPTLDDPGLTGIIESPKAPAKEDPMELYDVQIQPSFPGGVDEMMRYLAKNIVYPDIARENNIQGLVVLSFIVGKDGSINDVAILKELGGGCSKEAVRVVKTMPNWRPGEANGHNVKVRFTLPVRFNLR